MSQNPVMVRAEQDLLRGAAPRERPIVEALEAIRVDAPWVASRVKELVELGMRRARSKKATAADMVAAVTAVKAVARLRGDWAAQETGQAAQPALPQTLVVQVTNVLQEMRDAGAVVDVTPQPK